MLATAEPALPAEAAACETDADWAAPVPIARIAGLCPDGRTTAEALEQAVRRRIAQRTWGRLRRLLVEVDSRRVFVRGCSPTYHVKQLALAAVLEALPAASVELDIQVAKTEPRPASWAAEGFLWPSTEEDGPDQGA
jgi:hypothetical protein